MDEDDRVVAKLLLLNVSEEKQGGAAVCAAMAWRVDSDNQATLQLSVMNLGDNATYLVILDTSGLITTAQRINALHNPHPKKNLAEYERVGKPTDDRINKRLALSRVLGDERYDAFKLSHVPECYFQ